MNTENVAFTYVGAEYIIANLLIALKRRKNRLFTSLGELMDLGSYIQQMSIEKDINAAFLISSDQIENATNGFSDYFEYSRVNNTICIKQQHCVKDLESKFVGYLPWEVTAFLVTTIDEFVKQMQ